MSRRPTRLRLTALEDRLTPAGWLDPGFGTGGIAAVGLGGPWTSPVKRLAVTADGHFLVAGSDPADFSTVEIARLNADGSPDRTFGTAGVVRILPTAVGYVAPATVAAGPNGTVYVLTNSASGDPIPFAAQVTRLTASGDLDPTFGVGGRATVWPTAYTYTSGVLGARPDGTVFVASGTVAMIGELSAGGTKAGELFAKSTTEPGTEGLISGICPTPDGGILLASNATLTGPDDPHTVHRVLRLSKLTAAGQPDAGYGTDGEAVVGLPDSRWNLDAFKALPLGFDPAGNFLIAASNSDLNAAAASKNELVRLTPTGHLDAGFGTGGVLDLALPGRATVDAAAVLADGRVLLVANRAGVNRANTGFGMMAHLLAADGTADAGFADGGWLNFTSLGHAQISAGEALTLPDGRVALLAVAGNYSLSDPLQIAMLSLTAATPAGGLDGETPPVLPPVVVSPPVVPVAPVLPPAAGNPVSGGPVLPSLVSPASGDVNGDGVTDKVVTAGSAVSVVSGTDGSVLIKPFAPFEASYTGALNAVLVDIGGSGRAALVVSPGRGGGPVVAVYNADGTERGRFLGIDDPDFRGGVNLTVSYGLFVTAGQGGGPRVAVFDTATLGADARRLRPDFFALESDQRGGVVATEAGGVILFAAGPGGGPRVRAFDSYAMRNTAFTSLDDLPAQARTFDKFVGDPNARDGVTLSVHPTGVVLDAANPRGFRQEVTTDSGPGRQEVVYPFDEYDIREVHPLSDRKSVV